MAGRHLTLTYLCCPDPDPGGPGQPVTPEAGHHNGTDPSRPASADVTIAAVLHHGIDHLAWLADHHRELTRAPIELDPTTWRHIAQAGRHRAGRFGNTTIRTAPAAS